MAWFPFQASYLITPFQDFFAKQRILLKTAGLAVSGGRPLYMPVAQAEFPDGPNIGFTVPGDGGDAVFFYDRNTGEINLGINPPSNPVPVPQAFTGDGVIYQPAIRHDSRSDLYRSPFGAQPTGTDVTLRLRTAAGDVEGVTLLWGSVSDGVVRYTPMQAAAADERYAWWETTINTGEAIAAGMAAGAAM